MSYRSRFVETDDARSYDEREYGDGSYGQLLWRIEQEQLGAIISQFRKTHSTIDYLDFAAGTGRILSFVEPMVDTSVGIEISESMVARARSRTTRATLLCRDITVAGAELESTYDVITAFRFILNAEPALRLAAMSALRRRLRDGTSVIVFNNHGNMWSHKALLYPMHSLRHCRRPRTSGNYLTHRQVLRLASNAGLSAERTCGSGLLGGRLARLASSRRVERWERSMARSPISRWGANQIYVARLA